MLNYSAQGVAHGAAATLDWGRFAAETIQYLDLASLPKGWKMKPIKDMELEDLTKLYKHLRALEQLGTPIEFLRAEKSRKTIPLKRGEQATTFRMKGRAKPVEAEPPVFDEEDALDRDSDEDGSWAADPEGNESPDSEEFFDDEDVSDEGSDDEGSGDEGGSGEEDGAPSDGEDNAVGPPAADRAAIDAAVGAWFDRVDPGHRELEASGEGDGELEADGEGDGKLTKKKDRVRDRLSAQTVAYLCKLTKPPPHAGKAIQSSRQAASGKAARGKERSGKERSAKERERGEELAGQEGEGCQGRKDRKRNVRSLQEARGEDGEGEQERIAEERDGGEEPGGEEGEGGQERKERKRKERKRKGARGEDGEGEQEPILEERDGGEEAGGEEGEGGQERSRKEPSGEDGKRETEASSQGSQNVRQDGLNKMSS